MSDRHSGYLVALEVDVREDDAAVIISALRMIKGVLDVRPVVRDPSDEIQQMRADMRWRERLWKITQERDDWK
jgi:hypothetical protein